MSLILDADTSEPEAVQERYEFLRYALQQASPDVRFKLFLAVPEIEILFVQDMDFIKRISGKSAFSEIEAEFARLHPKKFLSDVLKEKIPSPITSHILSYMDERTIGIIRNHDLLRQLNEFLGSFREQN